MTLAAGELDQRVSITTRVFALNAANEEVEAGRATITRWAKVIEGSGREYVAADRQTAEKRITVLLRRGVAVSSKAVLTWNGRDYEIEDISRLGLDGLQLMCRSISTDVNT